MSVMAKRYRAGEKLPETWLDLQVKLCGLRPIHTEKEHERAVAAAGLLAAAEQLNKDQQDYLVSLSLVIEAYEREHFRLETDEVGPVEIIESLLEDNDMSASDLGRLLGDRSLGTRILKGQRQLSKTHIRILCEHFKVSPEIFF